MTIGCSNDCIADGPQRTRSASSCSSGSSTNGNFGGGNMHVTCDSCFTQQRFCSHCGCEYALQVERTTSRPSSRSASVSAQATTSGTAVSSRAGDASEPAHAGSALGPPASGSSAKLCESMSPPDSPSISATVMMPTMSPLGSSTQLASGVTWRRTCLRCRSVSSWSFCGSCRAPYSTLSLHEPLDPLDHEHQTPQLKVVEKKGNLFKREAKTQRFIMRRYVAQSLPCPILFWPLRLVAKSSAVFNSQLTMSHKLQVLLERPNAELL